MSKESGRQTERRPAAEAAPSGHHSKDGMPEFKRNHEVPRSLIAKWRPTGQRGEPVWVFDFRRQKVYRSASTDRSAFKFAALPHRYVVQLSNRRATEVERWLSRGEDAVATLVRYVDLDISRFVGVEEVVPLLFGLVALGFRSAHVLGTWERWMRDPDIQRQLDRFPQTDAELRKLVLENLVNVVDMRVRQLTPPRLEIVRGLGADLLLCDQPAIVLDEDMLVVLGPRSIVHIRRGTRAEMIVTDMPVSGLSLVNTVNGLTVDAARRWIVARTYEQLAEYLPKLTRRAVDERVAAERPNAHPPREGAGWWVIGDREP